MVSDLRYCSTCKYAASGYGFVSSVQGINPNTCPRCKQATFKQVSTLGFLFRVVKNLITG